MNIEALVLTHSEPLSTDVYKIQKPVVSLFGMLKYFNCHPRDTVSIYYTVNMRAVRQIR